MKKHIPILFQFLALFVSLSLLSQSPQGIPYQAVMRNADGTVMASSAVNLTFMIHDGTATGSVVFQESHALTSNAQGLVSCVVGNGVVSQGNFANINWGSGAKFLHVMMGTTDLGTQQMLSVPYAFYAKRSGELSISISAIGDTLFLGESNVVIIPRLSISNGPQANSGDALMPGNDTCDDQYISISGCADQTTLDYGNTTYDLVEIGGQCWFADNLATDQYSNGDPIITGLDYVTWGSTTSGAYAIYNNDPANDVTYGKLYNWYTTVDSRGLCPTGWHVPTDCEWMYLEYSLNMSPWIVENFDFRGTNQGSKLRSANSWSTSNVYANNSSGFGAIPGGFYDGGTFYDIGDRGNWWSSSALDAYTALNRSLYFNNSMIQRGANVYSFGFSIRCLKD